ncbi:parallel beta-helix repeat protein with two copies, partial [Calderihabitans maritimus]
ASASPLRGENRWSCKRTVTCRACTGVSIRCSLGRRHPMPQLQWNS